MPIGRGVAAGLGALVFVACALVGNSLVVFEEDAVATIQEAGPTMMRVVFALESLGLAALMVFIVATAGRIGTPGAPTRWLALAAGALAVGIKLGSFAPALVAVEGAQTGMASADVELLLRVNDAGFALFAFCVGGFLIALAAGTGHHVAWRISAGTLGVALAAAFVWWNASWSFIPMGLTMLWLACFGIASVAVGMRGRRAVGHAVPA